MGTGAHVLTKRRELSVAVAILLLFGMLAIAAPDYFSRANLQDMFLSNVPALIVALGMMVVILTGQIDISVGSQFAIASVVAGYAAKAIAAQTAAPALVMIVAACIAGAVMGAVNGALVGYLRIPSIVVTLAAMVAWRDALRWTTQGAWVDNLPPWFQWLGVSPSSYPVIMFLVAIALTGLFAWGLRNVAAGRAVYATGSNAVAARLAGVNVQMVTLSSFMCLGTLTGLAAALNAVRFNQIPSNAGIGLEMKVIAAVVVGGTAIAGGRGTIVGTVLAAILLGAIGPALTFLGVNAYWEKALQGALILTAIVFDRLPKASPTRAQEAHAGTPAGSRA